LRVRRFKKRSIRIEMTPLIDMMFLLMATFIYSTIHMIIQRGIPVKLPEAETSLINKKNYTVISITKEGKIYFEKIPVDCNTLLKLLEEKRIQNPNVNVFINADKRALHGMVVKVLDIVRKANIFKVSFETKEKEVSSP